jgi:outer membrane beta-barrel protein
MMKKSFLYLLLAAVVLTSLPAFAEKFSSDDEEDIPVVTVRKRYFLKTQRFEFGPSLAWVPNDTFVRSFALGGTIGYHFSESFFFEVPFAYFLNSESDSTDFLQNNFGIAPDTDDMNYYATAQFGWSPIYGKLNFLSKKIVYFDASAYAGIGATDSEIVGVSPHFTIGIAQRFVLSKWVALRFDLKDNIVYRTDDVGVDSTIRHVIFVMMGVNFFLPMK